MSNIYNILFSLHLVLLSIYNVGAKDIEPRRWTPLPLKTHIIGMGYGYTDGKIFFDPVIGIEDASIQGSSFVLQYVRPFKIATKLGRLDVMLPYSFVKWEGLLSGTPASVSRSGFSDPRLRLSVNIVGPDAMDIKELQEYFIAHPVYTVVGVSLAVTLPLGQYYDDRLLNLGQNRFVFRPQVGMTHTWRNWSYELTGSVFLFSNNNNFYRETTRKQNPVFEIQTHLIRRFGQGIWSSVSLGTGLAGQSLVNNQPNRDEQENVMVALSFGLPIAKKQVVKVVYIRSQTLSNIGGDTNMFAAVWTGIL